jgi:hypothetical protein
MRRFLRYALFATIVSGIASATMIGWLRWRSTRDVMVLDGGRCFSGQLVSIPLKLDFPGYTLARFEGSCGCTSLESRLGEIAFPASISPDDVFFVKIDTSGRTGAHDFSFVLELKKAGTSRLHYVRCRLVIEPAWRVQPDVLYGRNVKTSEAQQFRISVFQKMDQRTMAVERVEVSHPERMNATVAFVDHDDANHLLAIDKSFHRTYDDEERAVIAVNLGEPHHLQSVPAPRCPVMAGGQQSID